MARGGATTRRRNIRVVPDWLDASSRRRRKADEAEALARRRAQAEAQAEREEALAAEEMMRYLRKDVATPRQVLDANKIVA